MSRWRRRRHALAHSTCSRRQEMQTANGVVDDDRWHLELQSQLSLRAARRLQLFAPVARSFWARRRPNAICSVHERKWKIFRCSRSLSTRSRLTTIILRSTRRFVASCRALVRIELAQTRAACKRRAAAKARRHRRSAAERRRPRL